MPGYYLRLIYHKGEILERKSMPGSPEGESSQGFLNAQNLK